MSMIIKHVHISELKGEARSDTIPLVTDHHRIINMALTTLIETGVADAQKALADIETEKQKIVATLQTHIAQHNKAAAQHAAEVAAAQQIIQAAYPTATAAQSEAAAFVLTSKSTWVAGAVNFLGKNWRYVALGLIVLGVVAGCHYGLVKV